MAVIRLATPRDAESIAAIYAPSVTDTATSFELEPPDAAAMASRMEKVLAGNPWIVCEHEDRVAGYAYGGTHRERPAYRWTVEVSAYVDGKLHRSGVGRALYTSLLQILELQGYRTAVAGITLPNPASVGLHEAVGFRTVGVYHAIGYKFGRWHDVIWLERPLGDYAAVVPPPRPLQEVLGTEEFRAALGAGLFHLSLPPGR